MLLSSAEQEYLRFWVSLVIDGEDTVLMDMGSMGARAIHVSSV